MEKFGTKQSLFVLLVVRIAHKSITMPVTLPHTTWCMRGSAVAAAASHYRNTETPGQPHPTYQSRELGAGSCTLALQHSHSCQAGREAEQGHIHWEQASA